MLNINIYNFLINKDRRIMVECLRCKKIDKYVKIYRVVLTFPVFKHERIKRKIKKNSLCLSIIYMIS